MRDFILKSKLKTMSKKNKLTVIFLSGLLGLFAFSCETEIADNFCPGLSNCTTDNDPFRAFFFDDFNRANGLIDSATWTTVNSGGSSINITSNEIRPLSNASFVPVALHNTVVTASAFRISVNFRVDGTDFAANTANGNIGIFALSQSNANFTNAYFCGMQGSVNGDSLYVNSTVGGTSQGSTVDPGSIPLANGDSYTLTFTVQDDTLTCTISGSFSATVTLTDNNYSSGYSGFGGGNTVAAADGEIFFDNFLIEIID